MNYEETVQYMYDCLPMYHRVGQAAYKADITNTVQLMSHLGHPEQGFPSIHVAGTNGKGSVSHFLATILHKAGYSVGLYTSPHLVDFRERIRINGEMIPREEVVSFIADNRDFLASTGLSFFEMTVGMAFSYFARNKVDIAVIEVGMGGRLDSTNVISPLLSIITNISFDHTQFLGDTLAKIATEKAGIIKTHTPVVIGETHPETRPVFEARAAEMGSDILFADDHYLIEPDSSQEQPAGMTFNVLRHGTPLYAGLYSPLGGWYQQKNIATLMQALELLPTLGYPISLRDIQTGIADVIRDSGLHGRWEVIANNPLTICETAHNEAGIQCLLEKIQQFHCPTLRIVYGCVNDKDYHKIIRMMPRNARYYVTQPSVPRRLPVAQLAEAMAAEGFQCQPYDTCKEAISAARKEAHQDDIIIVTGSIYLVADAVTE